MAEISDPARCLLGPFAQPCLFVRSIEFAGVSCVGRRPSLPTPYHFVRSGRYVIDQLPQRFHSRASLAASRRCELG